MSHAGLAMAREVLRQKQGTGARNDAPSAPARALQWARLGTAYFVRKLGTLDDIALGAESRRAGVTRRRILAYVGLEARTMAQAIDNVCGQRCEVPAVCSEVALDLAETLPAHALRHLVVHAAAHLDVSWRDLTDRQWDLPIVTLPFRSARDTVATRARSLWMNALDLDAGGHISEAPAEFVAWLGQTAH